MDTKPELIELHPGHVEPEPGWFDVVLETGEVVRFNEEFLGQTFGYPDACSAAVAVWVYCEYELERVAEGMSELWGSPIHADDQEAALLALLALGRKARFSSRIQAAVALQAWAEDEEFVD